MQLLSLPHIHAAWIGKPAWRGYLREKRLRPSEYARFHPSVESPKLDVTRVWDGLWTGALYLMQMAGSHQVSCIKSEGPRRDATTQAYEGPSGSIALLHIVMGTAVAGTTLASTNIALKLSPRGSATAYVASNALATAAAAGMAPILGGLLADFFARRELELMVRWTSPEGSLMLPVSLTHWDFYFLLSGIIGLFAVHRLSLVAEEGEINAREMAGEVAGHALRTVRNISSVAGLRGATELPATLPRDARVWFRFLRRQGPTARRETAPQDRFPGGWKRWLMV